MKRIIVDIKDGESRIALTENDELKEFYIEKHHYNKIVGNVYKGRVENILPGMQAAFINIGIEKNAFLYVKDTRVLMEEQQDEEEIIPINEILKRNQELMVQIIKEPIDQKGARVTTNITIPGRYLVLMPMVDYIGVSRRISMEEEKDRLKGIVKEILPPSTGVIIRTEAEGIEREEFIQDLQFLLRVWEKIEIKNKIVIAPNLIHEELELTYRTVRDLFTKDIEEFVVNKKEHYEKVVEMVKMISPKLIDRVVFYKKDQNIFNDYNVNQQIGEMLSKKVWLKCGGYIIIDRTEALTVVDVNTGKYVGSINLRDTVLKTNIQAAKEIAKQLRLRNIGGIIIIDFIDMEKSEDEEKVLDTLKEALEKDKVKTNVLGITQLGLVELTRKKVRKSIGRMLQDTCPLCEGTGHVPSFDSLIREIDGIIHRNPHLLEGESAYLHINPYTTTRIENNDNNILKRLRDRYPIELKIVSDNTLSHDQVKILKHK